MEYTIQPGQSIDYEVDYEEETRRLVKSSGDEFIKKQELLDILFTGTDHKIKSKLQISALTFAFRDKLEGPKFLSLQDNEG